jgi:ferredoxin
MFQFPGDGMRIVIKSEQCTACGVCVSYCPDAFTFDRRGKVAIRYWEIPVGLEKDCSQIAEICPENALEVIYFV